MRSHRGVCVPARQESVLLQTQGPCQHQGLDFFFYIQSYCACFCNLYCCEFAIHLFQLVTGTEFEVPRRVYVDFDGINLRKKFLTGLEPESVNMTIGEYL